MPQDADRANSRKREVSRRAVLSGGAALSAMTLTRGGGAGFTFEGQGIATSAPGTESFKQDFARWEDLRRQMSMALEQAQTSIAKKLQTRESKERLAAGADDKAPPEYQKQVDAYFKAIAAKKKGS